MMKIVFDVLYYLYYIAIIFLVCYLLKEYIKTKQKIYIPLISFFIFKFMFIFHFSATIYFIFRNLYILSFIIFIGIIMIEAFKNIKK